MERFAVLVLIAILSYAELIQSLPFRISTQEKHEKFQRDVEDFYRRFYQRRVSEFPDDLYADEVHEIFKMESEPTAYLIDDADIEKMFMCELDPSLDICKDLIREVPKQPEVQIPHVDPFSPENVEEPPQFYLDDTEILRLIICDFHPTEDCERMPAYQRRAETTTKSSGDIGATIVATTHKPFQEWEEFPFLPEIPEETTEEATTQETEEETTQATNDDEADEATNAIVESAEEVDSGDTWVDGNEDTTNDYNEQPTENTRLEENEINNNNNMNSGEEYMKKEFSNEQNVVGDIEENNEIPDYEDYDEDI